MSTGRNRSQGSHSANQEGRRSNVAERATRSRTAALNWCRLRSPSLTGALAWVDPRIGEQNGSRPSGAQRRRSEAELRSEDDGVSPRRVRPRQVSGHLAAEGGPTHASDPRGPPCRPAAPSCACSFSRPSAVRTPQPSRPSLRRSAAPSSRRPAAAFRRGGLPSEVNAARSATRPRWDGRCPWTRMAVRSSCRRTV